MRRKPRVTAIAAAVSVFSPNRVSEPAEQAARRRDGHGVVPGSGGLDRVRPGAGPAVEPPGVDPGTPPFTGLADPIPDQPAAFDPSRSTLQAIFNADVRAGGTSYWFDRILARPFSAAANENMLLTRGRALYMYTHNPGVLGFAGRGTGPNGGGGYAYRQPPTTGVGNLYTITLSGDPLTEDTSQRIQYPSYYSAVFTRTGLTVDEKKFITDNDVAVTDLTLTNTSDAPETTTLTASSPIATTPSSDGTELTGTVNLRYALTTIFPRMSGDGFGVDGTSLTRTVTLDPGASTSLKVQLGAIANEMPRHRRPTTRATAP